MPTVGNQPASWVGYLCQGTTYNQVASAFTMPAGGGYINQIGAYFDLYSGSGTGYVCVWNNSTGALIASASVGTLGAASCGAGLQGWHSASISPPVFVAGGTSILIGFAVPTANGFSTSSGTGGSSVMGTGGNGTFTGSTSTTIGTIGAYAGYLTSISKGKRWKVGTGWVGLTPKRWKVGTGWVGLTPKRWKAGTGWVNIS